MQHAVTDLDTLPRNYYDEMIRRFGYMPDDRDYQELFTLLHENNRRTITADDIPLDDFKDRQKMLQVYRRIQRIQGAHVEKNQGDRVQLKSDLDEMMHGYAVRVEKHKLIELYLRKVSDPCPPPSLGRKLRNMESCHAAGVVGIHPDGKKIIAWDHKCGDTRMCPHAAWKESRRLIEMYHAAILEQLDRDKRRRLFYSVLTMPNVREESLLEGKKELYELTKKFLTMKTLACPLVLNGHGRYKKTDAFSMAGCVQGSLVTQEDPLGSNYSWHIHNNLIMVTAGQFDYALAREWWSELVFGCKRDPRDDKKKAVLHFDPVEREGLSKTLIEIIKYPVLTVGEKSMDSDTAPSMTEWPMSLFYTWYNANHGFRRTRSYGCLYAVDRKRWDGRDSQGRYNDFFQPARETRYPDLPLEYVGMPWTTIPEKDRAKLKRQMRCPEVFSLDGVRWVGNVLFLESLGGYYVDLSAPNDHISVASILGDNFLRNSEQTNKFSRPPPFH